MLAVVLNRPLHTVERRQKRLFLCVHTVFSELCTRKALTISFTFGPSSFQISRSEAYFIIFCAEPSFSMKLESTDGVAQQFSPVDDIMNCFAFL